MKKVTSRCASRNSRLSLSFQSTFHIEIPIIFSRWREKCHPPPPPKSEDLTPGDIPSRACVSSSFVVASWRYNEGGLKLRSQPGFLTLVVPDEGQLHFQTIWQVSPSSRCVFLAHTRWCRTPVLSVATTLGQKWERENPSVDHVGAC